MTAIPRAPTASPRASGSRGVLLVALLRRVLDRRLRLLDLAVETGHLTIFRISYFHSVSKLRQHVVSSFSSEFLRAGQSPQNVGEHSLGYMPMPWGPIIGYRNPHGRSGCSFWKRPRGAVVAKLPLKITAIAA